MTYEEAVRYLMTLGAELAAPRQPAREAALPAAKFDLRNIMLLADRLDSPHLAYPTAHIAGTNGKGSTAAMLESILRAAGMRTGLFTSPHLERINERIRVDSEPVSDDEFAAAFTRIQALSEVLLASGSLAAHPTFFECVTAMAFDHFARCAPTPAFRCHPERSEGSALGPGHGSSHGASADSSSRRGSASPPLLGMTGEEHGVDFAVFEVGLGGRLDSTNILQPEVAVITPIDFDHENYLGHSIPEIAAEKAGIIKPGAWVVSSAERPEAREVIRRRCAQQAARLVEIDEAYETVEAHAIAGAASSAPTPARVVVRERNTGRAIEFTLPLAGRFQVRNAVAALVAARLLAQRGFGVDDAAIAAGLSSVRWPGRLERISERPEVILDGTHNPAGARELVAYWQEHWAGRRVHLIFGAVRDKAVDEIAGLIFPLAETVFITSPRQPRAISASALHDMTAHHAARCEMVADPAAALDHALAAAAPDDVVLATGSLYLVGELRRAWQARAGRNPEAVRQAR